MPSDKSLDKIQICMMQILQDIGLNGIRYVLIHCYGNDSTEMEVAFTGSKGTHRCNTSKSLRKLLCDYMRDCGYRAGVAVINPEGTLRVAKYRALLDMDSIVERENWLKLISSTIKERLEVEALDLTIQVACVSNVDEGNYRIDGVTAHIGDDVKITDTSVYDLVFDLARASRLKDGDTLIATADSGRYTLRTETKAGGVCATYNVWA